MSKLENGILFSGDDMFVLHQGKRVAKAVTPSARPKPVRKNDDAEAIAAGLLAFMRRRQNFRPSGHRA